jgi:hypothetical protein
MIKIFGQKHRRNISEIINLWKALQEQIIVLVENISEDALLKTYDITKDEKCTLTLEFLIRDYAAHQLYHLESIKK